MVAYSIFPRRGWWLGGRLFKRRFRVRPEGDDITVEPTLALNRDVEAKGGCDVRQCSMYLLKQGGKVGGKMPL